MLKHLLILCVVTTSLYRAHEGIGPYDVKIYESGKCSDDLKSTNKIDFSGLLISRVGRNTQALHGNMNFSIPFDDSIMVNVDIARFGNGGWKPHFLQFDVNGACNGSKIFFPAYYKVMSDAHNFTGCPFPPGSYNCNNLTIPNEKFAISQSFPYGKYRVEISFNKDEENVGCVLMYAEFVPKKILKKKG